MDKDWFQRGVAGLVLAGGALAAYAFLIEPRWLERTRTRLFVPELAPGLDGFRIALLTDLHAGRGTPLSLVRRACRLALEARPHLIALTGDFVSDAEGRLAGVVDVLDELLDAPLGVYAVPGNHDHRAGIDAWERQIHDGRRMIDLTNRVVRRRMRGATVWVAGVDDLSRGDPQTDEVVPAPEAQDFTLLLSHDPDVAERACRTLGPVDLVLSGHTHGGQVRLPGVGALRNPSRYDDIYEQGLTPRPWAHVYVSRGIGTVHLPVRFLCRPEVAIIELRGTPAS